ncbi:ABC-type transport auxiliary lipoprotein family protein [Methylocapsa sp. S129]|uniref:ABC-type transport auxiliary lipoprotein family protein n=1 Tax=Methylocapsa sp. S129 TaxID=1641869 RepID=UPI00131ACDDA|nr:ABC-type transport auxiliary lipoprotein family protein [Methylocapsa sp. S129]
MAMPRARALRMGLALSAALLAAACGGSAPETFDLSAAAVPAAHKLRAQIAIREPLASQDLDSQRILVRTGPEAVAYLAGAQWSDRLPALVQTRLVQTFQNAQLVQSVARAGSGFTPDYSLELDIRAFELDAKGAQADVDIAAKIVDDRGGRIVAARIFKMQVPAGGTDGAQASVALNAALSTVMAQIVAFTAAQI